MQNYLYADIETLPAQRPDVLEEIRASIKPPGNIKKPESIAAWMETEADAAADEAYRKTGLDGAYGQVCVIGFAVDNDKPVALRVADWQRGECEADVLADFCDALESLIHPANHRGVIVVGHNICNFDLRFLVQRHIVHGIQPHPIIRAASQAKPWDANVFDTMVQWAGVGKTISLDKLCKALSIPSPKGDITGATVWDAVKAGRIADVAAYCARDVETTRAVHRRLTFRKVEELEDVPA